MLDQGGEEYEEGVPGQGLPHAHPPAEAVRHEAVLLEEPPGVARPLQEPLGEEGEGLLPVVGVLRHGRDQVVMTVTRGMVQVAMTREMVQAVMTVIKW